MKNCEAICFVSLFSDYTSKCVSASKKLVLDPILNVNAMFDRKKYFTGRAFPETTTDRKYI